ncbi:MAG: DUF1801 domain-containing protein [Gemmatimonadaceae bacterium]
MTKTDAAKPESSEKQLARFLAKFNPPIGTLTRAIRRALRARLPHAIELVYDNYNFFVIGFGPTERPSEAILSIVVAPRTVSICFLRGVDLPDPHGLLQGAGNQVRHVRIASAADLDTPPLRALITAAVKNADPPFDRATAHRLVIRSISAKQRPRRPRAAPPIRRATQ